MATNVFIAPKIKVGFQKRSDTFTGQLAYIIYFDEKGKLRKEKSWEGWRDKKIAPQEFENTPMDGFTLNKDVKRYSGEWFSSHRTMIRVHDPRGFEFEVTTENLIGILMHTDCLRRGLIGQFVYAWVGPELVLLPTNSEEYQQAAKYTTGLAKKVSAKELIPGVSYKTKREGDVIYLGRFNWYEYSSKSRYSNRVGPRKEEKAHVFTKDDGKSFFRKSSVEFLAEPNNTSPVSNFAELVELFNKKSYANKIARYEFRPVSFNPEIVEKGGYNGISMKRSDYFKESSIPGVFEDCSVGVHTEWKIDPSDPQRQGKHVFAGFVFDTYHYGRDYQGIRAADGEMVAIQPVTDSRSGHYSYNSRRDVQSEDQMKVHKFYDFYIIFENGKSRRVKSLYDLSNETDI